MPEDTHTSEAWKRFGPALAAHRADAGLNQNQAARRAGVSPNTWGLVERGFRVIEDNEVPYRPTRNFIIKAAKAVHWDVAEALITAGFPPERLPADEEPPVAGKLLSVFNQLSKQQKDALVWVGELMLDPHAAYVRAPAPTPNVKRPVFTDSPDSPEGSRKNI